MNEEQVREVISLERESHLSSRNEENYLKLLDNSDAILLSATIENPDGSGPFLVAVFSGWIVIDELQIDNIAVKPAFRQKGLGTKILRMALSEAAGKGAVSAFLEVRSNNQPALELYTRSGFIVVGRRPDYYQNPADDALIMSLKFDSIQ